MMKLALRISLAAALAGLVSVPAVAAPVARKAPSQAIGPSSTGPSAQKIAPKAQKVSPQPMRLKRGKPLLHFDSGVTTYSGEPPLPGMKSATASKSSKMKKIEPPRLDRGEKAVLTPDHPVAEGVGLVGVKAEFQSLAMGSKPGFYFRGEQGWGALHPGAGFLLDPSHLDGDDLKVACRGDFPSKVEVEVVRGSGGWATERVTQTVPVSAGKAKFFVSPGTGDANVLLVLLHSTADGYYRLGQCTVERDVD